MSGSDMVNFTYIPEEKSEKIRSNLFNLVERQKNFFRLNSIASNECGKRCLDNFKTNKLSSQENICLTSCVEKFYNLLEIGENVYDVLNKNQVDSTPLLKGNFKSVLDKI